MGSTELIRRRMMGSDEDFSQWIDYYVYVSSNNITRAVFSGIGIARMMFEGEEITPIYSKTFEHSGTYNFKVLLNNPAAIPYNAFNAGHYRHIVLPACVESIGTSAFRNYNQSYLVCYAVVPPTLSVDPFGNAHSIAVYVPDASVEAYKSAWSMMTNIKPISELGGVILDYQPLSGYSAERSAA